MKTTKHTSKKLWVVYTQDLGYNLTALDVTEDAAKRAIWREFKRTNNKGYGIRPEITSVEKFFDYYGYRSYCLAPGEVESE